jgi:hypothetical protein
MNDLSRGRILGPALLFVLIFSSIGFLMGPSAAAVSQPSNGAVCKNDVLPDTRFVSAPPTGSKGPDDITRMAVNRFDNDRELIWTAFQNGINPDGTPGAPSGPVQSTVAGYDPYTGALVQSILVTGKVDGLTADPEVGALIATVNEDVHSGFDLIYPATGNVATYTYSPDPAVANNGGTDSIAVSDGHIYVSHSNPNDITQPTEYKVTLDRSTPTLTANLTPVFYDNSTATDVPTGATVQLGLTDPDTNFVMPHDSPRFAGDLATISQSDGEIVFASHLTHNPRLWLLGLTDNIPGNVPPIDGLAVATSDEGSLYMVDAKAGTIQALNTDGCAKGTVFVTEPSDNGNPLLGTLNLLTGKITPLGNHFQSPKGLLFVADNGQEEPGQHDF